jgi:GxxExxY protein
MFTLFSGRGYWKALIKAVSSMSSESAALRWPAKVGLPVVFDGVKIELGYRIDLVVENLVIVEVKTVDAIHPVHQAQLLSYMQLSGIAVGLLINFYVTHLRDGIKRMVDGKNWEK